MLDNLYILKPFRISRPTKNSVLIVDDDEIIITLLRQVIQTAPGVEGILTVNNGAAAISRMITYSNEIGALVLDVSMPDLNGFEVCNFIKLIPELAHVPIIMLTARPITDVVEQARLCGANYLMSKPFDCEKLRMLVAGCLGHAPIYPQQWHRPRNRSTGELAARCA
jgi:CheY-like chemotaxis protein